MSHSIKSVIVKPWNKGDQVVGGGLVSSGQLYGYIRVIHADSLNITIILLTEKESQYISMID